MTLHYIFHSCFVAESVDFLIVYDFWRDPDGRLQVLLDQAIARGAEVYFVVSHFHEDHYNPLVVDWCSDYATWHLLPSYDTVKRRRIPADLPLEVLRFDTEVATPYFTLHAFRSTDVGVSTVARLHDGTTLFHAGDCNNWYFPAQDTDRVKVTPDQMEKLYLSILRDIKKHYPHLDHVMFPVDPRLGQEMLRGLMQLLHTFDVCELHPMHYCLPANV